MKKIYKTPRTKSINLEGEALLAASPILKGLLLKNEQDNKYDTDINDYTIPGQTEGYNLTNEKIRENVFTDDNQY